MLCRRATCQTADTKVKLHNLRRLDHLQVVNIVNFCPYLDEVTIARNKLRAQHAHFLGTLALPIHSALPHLDYLFYGSVLDGVMSPISADWNIEHRIFFRRGCLSSPNMPDRVSAYEVRVEDLSGVTNERLLEVPLCHKSILGDEYSSERGEIFFGEE